MQKKSSINKRNRQLSSLRTFTGSHGFTERERDVVTLVASGYSNADIARELAITLATVKTHVHKVLEKVGAKSRTELAVRIMREMASQSKD
jgi:DNA-binding NarL/FixJ family response regulator